MTQSRAWTLLAVAAVLSALALRLWGIAANAPFVYDPTEHVVLHRALDIFRERDLDPHWFLQPTLLIYVQTLLIAVLQPFVHAPLTTNAALNGIGPGDVLPAQFPFLLAGRLFVAVAGTAAVAGVAAVGRRWHSAASGAAAAVLLAVVPLAVDRAHVLAIDTPATFFVVAALWATLRAEAAGRGWFVAGILAGLAVATSYGTAFVLLAPVVAALDVRRPLVTFERLLYVFGGAVAAFLFACPYALLDLNAALRELRAQSDHLAGVAASRSAWWWVASLWRSQLHAGAAAAVVIGAAFASHRGRRADWAVLLPTAAAVVVLATDRTRSASVLVFFLPFACLLAGRAVSEVGQRLCGPPWADAAIALVALCLAVPPARAAIAASSARTLPDTRTLAWHWIDEHIPAGACVVREEYTPQVSPARYHVDFIGSLAQQPYHWYLARGCRYLVASSYVYDTIRDGSATTAAEFYGILFGLPRLAELDPGPGARGPTIRIVELPGDS